MQQESAALQAELLEADAQLAEVGRQERARYEEAAAVKRAELAKLREGAALNEASRAKAAEGRREKMQVRPRVAGGWMCLWRAARALRLPA